MFYVTDTYINKHTKDRQSVTVARSCSGCHIRIQSTVVMNEVYLNKTQINR